MTGRSQDETGKRRGGAERRDRLGSQLRANLQRRKAQARARAAGSDDTDFAAATSADGTLGRETHGDEKT